MWSFWRWGSLFSYDAIWALCRLGPSPFMNFRTAKTCSWLMPNKRSGYSFISPHFAIFIFLCFLFSFQASGRVKWPTVDASYYGGGGVGGITPVRVGVRPWLPPWFLVCNNYMTKIATCSRYWSLNVVVGGGGGGYMLGSLKVHLGRRHVRLRWWVDDTGNWIQRWSDIIFCGKKFAGS